jgi:pimeloyl-ACP methyl ester carboxylesterase
VAAGFQVVRFDHRDIGESTRLRGRAPKPMPLLARRLVGARVAAPYSLSDMASDVVGLLDHLGIAQAVVGGTSLGANVALEVAVLAPERVRALVLEMPVLENALPAAAAAFVPLALALRVSQRTMRLLSAVTRRVPRTAFLVDLMLDFVRRDPAASLAVLDGLIFGRVAPPIEDRRALAHPTLVIGHPSDPIHPFSDADRIARELANARLVTASSIAEWRLRPDRLNRELGGFLDEVWRPASIDRVARPYG